MTAHTPRRTTFPEVVPEFRGFSRYSRLSYPRGYPTTRPGLPPHSSYPRRHRCCPGLTHDTQRQPVLLVGRQNVRDVQRTHAGSLFRTTHGGAGSGGSTSTIAASFVDVASEAAGSFRLRGAWRLAGGAGRRVMKASLA
jgi:hypothetical protein